MIRSVFISRNLEEVPELSEFCAQRNIRLTAQSLIRFKAVPFSITEEYPVIFFSSIRAAHFFLLEKELAPSTAIACIGAETALKLKQLGLECEFVGDKAGDPESVAAAFKNWLGDRKVLIPCSDRSNRSVANALPEGQSQEVIVYKTIHDPVLINDCDIYIFSSPTNVESFFKENILPDPAAVISWGKTTDRALQKHDITPVHTLQHSSNKEIVSWLEKQA